MKFPWSHPYRSHFLVANGSPASSWIKQKRDLLKDTGSLGRVEKLAQGCFQEQCLKPHWRTGLVKKTQEWLWPPCTRSQELECHCHQHWRHFWASSSTWQPLPSCTSQVELSQRTNAFPPMPHSEHMSPKDKSCWQSRSGTHFWAYLSELGFSLLPRPTSKVWLPVLRTTSSPDEWQMPSSIWVDYLEDDGQPKVQQLSTIHLSKAHWESWGSAGPIMA